MSVNSNHQAVLPDEVVAGLDLKSGQTVLDGTIGGGGHADLLAQAITPGGHMIGFDMDEQALNNIEDLSHRYAIKVTSVKDNFRRADIILKNLGIDKLNGALLDLGFSSDQLTAGRGLSFQVPTDPLIMSLGTGEPESKMTAADILNSYSEQELADIFFYYGEEKKARLYAKVIVKARKNKPLLTVGDLLEVLEPVTGQSRRLHFATKVFQALRIAVNEELEALKEGMIGIWKHLDKGGRLAVISFHGLEAKVTKDVFKDFKLKQEGRIITKNAIKATRAEILKNPRARSAQLRIIEKI
ncbi:MAG: 16S rRNA (cytosine(1402)-N(4))-methyltransferase RsmH [Patescibacteria group bacterium]